MMINVQKVDPCDHGLLKRNDSSNSLKALLKQQQYPRAMSPSSEIVRTLTLDHFLSEHQQLYQNIKKVNSIKPSASTRPSSVNSIKPSASTRPSSAGAQISTSHDDVEIDNNEVSKRLQLIHKESIKKRLTVEKTIETLQAKGWNMI